MKILRVVGARPQFMQVPVLQNLLIDAGHEHTLLHTGQHFDENMSDVFFKELGLKKPAFNLAISNLPHGAMTGRIMEGVENFMKENKTEVLIVDGDTNSTMAAALAAVKLAIPIIHVEAGTRDCSKINERPEEINRRVTDHISTLNCAPVPLALKNLQSEGLDNTSFLSGDVLLDCFKNFSNKCKKSIFKDFNLKLDDYYLATIHRPENTDMCNYERFENIFNFLSSLDKVVLLPIHPRTRKIFQEWESRGNYSQNFKVINPLSYIDILSLLKGAAGVFTDSGGLCRDSVWSGCKTVLLFTKDTWHDLISNGWATIGKGNRESIEEAWSKCRYPNVSEAHDLFGGGKASYRIAKSIDKII